MYDSQTPKFLPACTTAQLIFYLSYGCTDAVSWLIDEPLLKNYLPTEYKCCCAPSRQQFFHHASKEYIQESIHWYPSRRPAVHKMSLEKSTPKGLKVVECGCGMGSKKAPIHYIPEQDPVQDTLEKSKRPCTSS